MTPFASKVSLKKTGKFTPVRSTVSTMTVVLLMGCQAQMQATQPLMVEEVGGSSLRLAQDVEGNHKSSPVPLSLIAGGAAPLEGEPLARSVALVMIVGVRSNDFKILGFCSGALISRELILTAAHCFQEVQSLKSKNEKLSALIHFGPVSMSGGIKSELTFRARSFRVHAGYHSSAGGVSVNDIALIRLDRSAPIELTPLSIAGSAVEAIEGTLVKVAGYGPAANKGDKDSGEFQLQILESRIKTSWYSEQKALNKYSISLGNSSGIERGDSGGPMILHVNNQPFIAGIASEVVGFQAQTGEVRLSLFEKIEMQKKWILATARALGSQIDDLIQPSNSLEHQ